MGGLYLFSLSFQRFCSAEIYPWAFLHQDIATGKLYSIYIKEKLNTNRNTRKVLQQKITYDDKAVAPLHI